MIYSISSNQRSFKKVLLSKGLNVIVAQRKTDSDPKKTTNSRGKSTLIAIINFCLGSDAVRSGLCIEALAGWEFTFEMMLFHRRVTVTRTIDSPAKIYIDGDTDEWPVKLDYDDIAQKYFLGLDKWKQLLGEALFTIPQTNDLSVRSLISYFIRAGNDGYNTPLKFFSSQANNNAHIYNAFFVGLEPKYAIQWCQLDQQTKAIKAFDNAIKAGVCETPGELEAKKVELEEALVKSRNVLSTFKVHEKYQEIQLEANRLTDELHQLTNQNIVEARKLQNYENATAQETPPNPIQLETIYSETGIVFPDTVKRTLEEARFFHKQVIKNRAVFLEAEIVRIKREIADREERIKNLMDKRSACMQILSTHGALEEYSRLQEEHTVIKEKLEHVLNKIEDIRDRAKKSKELKSFKLQLDKEATIDYEEKREHWEQAIRLFNASAKALYGVSGEFVIDISEKGYQFSVDIPGGRGGGISKMQVFCYDLMVMCMQKVLGRPIDFLIHDSIIYEGVDQRQIAHAIEQAAAKAQQYDFQYIMTINSDMVPYHDFCDGFHFDEYIKLRLSDHDVSGSLLGISF